MYISDTHMIFMEVFNVSYSYSVYDTLRMVSYVHCAPVYSNDNDNDNMHMQVYGIMNEIYYMNASISHGFNLIQCNSIQFT